MRARLTCNSAAIHAQRSSREARHPGRSAALPADANTSCIGLLRSGCGPGKIRSPSRVSIHRMCAVRLTSAKAFSNLKMNFGKQGAVFHPELLDWLAGEFVAAEWSQKASPPADRHVLHINRQSFPNAGPETRRPWIL